jgi:hypothetical protein
MTFNDFRKLYRPTYIGDSVYVAYDGYHTWFITYNGEGDDLPLSNEIALQPSVAQAYIKFVKSLGINEL